jgi:trk system potassium uptake protein TrkH
MIIIVGTILLKLPFAVEAGHSVTWLEALFTATSATTVTGLVLFNTQATYSLFGEIVILCLIQVGGIGFITLSVMLFRLMGRRVSIYERDLLRQNLGVEGAGGVVRLTLVVLIGTVGVELAGALFLFSQWVQIMDWPQALYFSVFHSISAMCNAGFDLFTGLDDPRLLFTRNNHLQLLTLSALITIGTLGITVIYDLVTWPHERRLTLHTQIVLPFTLFLMGVGSLILIFEEEVTQGGAALADASITAKWLLAFFTVVSSRTAGITLIPMELLGEASTLVLTVWMFIGGAPASMGGGVGISTIAVILLVLRATVRGQVTVRVHERTIPSETVVKAIAILTVSIILVLTITLFLTLSEALPLDSLVFEVVSAFSNTGYSLGITGNLTDLGQILIAFTMFWGRLGPLTLVVALAQRQRPSLLQYPEEKIIIG